jgi:hypothetical protein
MTFPLTIDGTVRIEVPDVVSLPEKAALTALESGLERVRASGIWREESSLAFTVNWFRWWVFDWNLLTGIRSGAIDVAVSDGHLVVRFSLKSFDFLVLALMAGLAIAVSFPGGRGMGWAVLWTAIYAGDHLVRWLRFR